MEKQKKSRGFKGKVNWERSSKVDSPNGRGLRFGELRAMSTPQTWQGKGPSLTTVRTQKELRNLLKSQLNVENKRGKNLKLKKVKEVDAVNAALFEWICKARVNDLCDATLVNLIFKGPLGGWDFDMAKTHLGQYSKVTLVKESKDQKSWRWIMTVRFDRTLRLSGAFRSDLLIIASLISSYEILEYRKQSQKV